MSGPKPTAGPWRVDSAVGADWVYGADGTFVAKVGSSPGLTREQVSANAALIARAPDLLAERDELRAEVERLTEERDALFEEAKAACREIDARDGSRIAYEEFESIERWRAYRSILREALARKETRPC